MRFSNSAAAVAAIIPVALAQTFTSCNPLEKTCPQDTGLDSTTFSTDFTSGDHTSWSAAAGTSLTYGSQGAEFTINEAGQAPTIQSDFYIFFGRVDVKMQAAPGTGIVSSIVFESDDLDEIDWEFLGGNTTVVETNFFGKGNTTLYDRAIYYPVTTPQTEVHTYSVDWTSERLQWIIDGVVVRTLTYDNPLTVGGTQYPQTPMRIKLGNWAAGGPGEPSGTVTWAGGKTNFADAPFTMYVESVTVTNYNPADAYEWVGNSGSWQSIKLINGGTSSSPSGGSGSGSSSTASAGKSTTTDKKNSAPTKSVTVSDIKQTQVAVSTTVTGMSYSMNSASASAQNANSTGVSGATTTGASGSGSGSSSPTSSSNAPSATVNAAPAGGANAVLAAGSLITMLCGLMML